MCFDNRVQLLAAAGSGKTSVMVARAAYAVHPRLRHADRILLLAFNKTAAAELHDRVTARFTAAGIDATGVRASTFHSYGLNVIGEATGTKPRLASWLEHDGNGNAMVGQIVDQLRDRDPEFRYRWDLYRLLFARAPINLAEHDPDTWNTDTKESGYRTFGGDVVRSHGERIIADWLFLHGVTYCYEKPYAYNVADATHAQYRPDFYYPDIDVWHEHWAFGRDGKAPAEFSGYEESVAWKRRTHEHFGSALIETTWADVLLGEGLLGLRHELEARGQRLDWNPDRPVRDSWASPMAHEELYGLMRTFMAHVKSNSWSREQLDDRLSGARAPRGDRHADYSSVCTGQSPMSGTGDWRKRERWTSRTCLSGQRITWRRVMSTSALS